MTKTMGKIFIAEDEKDLIMEAEGAFSTEEYQIYEVDLEQANKPEYWESIDITKDDLVVLDLNFKMAYSGLDTLRLLETEKEKGHLAGLERVLVATSLKQQIDSPDVAFVNGFDVYGLEKGVDASRQVDVAAYGNCLLSKVKSIYSGSEKAVNEGWRM